MNKKKIIFFFFWSFILYTTTLQSSLHCTHADHGPKTEVTYTLGNGGRFCDHGGESTFSKTVTPYSLLYHVSSIPIMFYGVNDNEHVRELTVRVKRYKSPNTLFTTIPPHHQLMTPPGSPDRPKQKEADRAHIEEVITRTFELTFTSSVHIECTDTEVKIT